VFNTLRELFDQTEADLRLQRSPYEAHWDQVATYLAPYRFRLSTFEHNRGDFKNSRILNSAASLALRTYKTGMTAHNTSAARKWLSIGLEDQDLAEYGPVKYFTDQVADTLLDNWGRGRLYQNFPTFYGDQAGFSNAAMWVEEDDEDIVDTRVLLNGSFWWGVDHKGRVDTCFRRFRMTIRQVVMKWGAAGGDPRKIDWSRFSTHVKTEWDAGHYNTWIDVAHMVMPNPNYYPQLIGAKFKKWLSYYYEAGTGQGASAYLRAPDEGRFLSESGYDRFPVLAGRGEVAGEDVYAIDCPGMLATGDIKELQYHARKESKAIDKMIDPPMTGPPELKGKEVWGVPGKITLLAERDGQKGLRPIYQIDPRLDHLLLKSGKIERRIDEAFYVEFFRMLSRMSSESREMTATEIIKRQEEQVAQLEPTISGNNCDVLGPFTDFSFDIALRHGKLPPIPKELQGMRLKIEFVSTMAMAMKALGLGSIERVTQFTLQVAEVYPEVGDKVNWDQAVDEIASRTGAPGRIIVPDEVVQQIRAQRAKAAAAQQQAETLSNTAKSVKDLAASPTDGKNALTDLSDAIAENANGEAA
jgi:hypothetical protein